MPPSPPSPPPPAAAAPPGEGTPAATAGDVLAFWFAPGREAQWFASSPEFDAEVGRRLHAPCLEAAAGRLAAWAADPRGSLALAILGDQVPRNLFRGTARAFAGDAAALAVAKSALARGQDKALAPPERVFLYLPFEHSERMEDQQRSVALFSSLGLGEEATDYAERHLKIIARFGRFPHRNRALGRATTAEEAAYLDGGAERFGQ